MRDSRNLRPREAHDKGAYRSWLPYVLIVSCRTSQDSSLDRPIHTEQRVTDEQLQLLFAGLPSSLLATLVLLTLTAAVMHVTGAIHALPASLGILTITAARFFLWLAYRRHGHRENIAWSTLFFIGAIAGGAAWGLGAVVVFPVGIVAAQA